MIWCGIWADDRKKSVRKFIRLFFISICQREKPIEMVGIKNIFMRQTDLNKIERIHRRLLCEWRRKASRKMEIGGRNIDRLSERVRTHQRGTNNNNNNKHDNREKKRKEIDANQKEPIQLTQPKFVTVPIVCCLFKTNCVESHRKWQQQSNNNIKQTQYRAKKLNKNYMFNIKIRYCRMKRIEE